MATVPTGWAYYRTSTGVVYSAGQNMPYPPISGDVYYGVANGALDYSKIQYRYYLTRTVPYSSGYTDKELFPDGVDFNLPAGWEAENLSQYTMTTASILSDINGAVVNSVQLSKSKIRNLTITSNTVFLYLSSNKNIQVINGTFNNNLKQIYCYNCSNLTTVPSLQNATGCIVGNYAFAQCTSLTQLNYLPPNLKYAPQMFADCVNLQYVGAIPNTLLIASAMFQNCTSLTNAPINNSRIINTMYRMFEGCTSLVDLSDFYIPLTVRDLGYAFNGCSKIINLPTIRGTNVLCLGMCLDCISLKNPPNFEGTFENWWAIFQGCTALENAPIIPTEVTNLAQAFKDCSSLVTIPTIPPNVISLEKCFNNCTSLTWVSLSLPNKKNMVVSGMFEGCTNLTGIIWIPNQTQGTFGRMLKDTNKTIIIGTTTQYTTIEMIAATANNDNAYGGLLTTVEVFAVRTNQLGELDDEGEYIKITVNFVSPVINYSKLYVPKVYLKNDQLQPTQNWVLTYNDGEQIITKEIQDSTDITVPRIEANDLIGSGQFETLFDASDYSEGIILTTYVPTSCSQVTTGWDSEGDPIIETIYWGGTAGSAIFTGETFIFDALPDGTAFKIGGPVYEDETGFIVGNVNSTPYPSTFNGPITINGTAAIEQLATFYNDIYIDIDTNAGSGTDYEIYTALQTLGWDSDVIV